MRTEPLTYVVQHGDIVFADGTSLFVFETAQELAAWIALQNVWSKEQYRNELYALHDELYKRIWSTTEFISEPYQSHGELVSAAATVASPCHNEAHAILTWYWYTYDLIIDHLEEVNEQTANAQLFFNSLPIFSF